MSDPSRTLLDFLGFAERLRCELRHSRPSDGCRESDAEHGWRTALMALLAFEHLERPVDRQRVLEMILVQHLAEALAGAEPASGTGASRDGKAVRERRAMERTRRALDPDTGRHLFALFLEYETGTSSEARLVRALGRLEVQVQHALAGPVPSEETGCAPVCARTDAAIAHDAFLRRLSRAVREAAEAKMRSGGVDVAAARAAAGRAAV